MALLAVWTGPNPAPMPPDPRAPLGGEPTGSPAVGAGDDDREEPDPGRPYTFGVVGDWGYKPQQRRRLPALIHAMTGAGLAFTVHDGDIKDGPVPCHQAIYDETLRLFNRFGHPLIYTPGDNEWTDCWRSGGQPLDRLSAIRRTFFADGLSHGKRRMPLDRQSSRFPENARWSGAGVTFASVHIVGSNNGLPDDERPGDRAEHDSRTAAGLRWVGATFAAARSGGSAGVVLFIHGDPLFGRPPGERYGYDRFLAGVEREVLAFGKPVLLVHGDTHTYRLDRPWKTYSQPRRRLDNLTRLESFGPEEMGYVRVTVDRRSEAVFRVKPVYLGRRLD